MRIRLPHRALASPSLLARASLLATALLVPAGGCGRAPEAPAGPDLVLAEGMIWSGADEAPFEGRRMTN